MAETKGGQNTGTATEFKSSMIYLAVVAAFIFVPIAIPDVRLLYVVGFYLGAMIVAYIVICALGLFRTLRRDGA